MKARTAAGSIASAAIVELGPTTAGASHGRDYAAGSGKNTFATGGPGHISFAAHDKQVGSLGYFRARGDLTAVGPPDPFAFAGHVTCVRVEGNRAAIKYRFERAEGSGAPFAGGGVQVFVEDNGPPGGVPDRTAFDLPQTAATFNLNASQCDDPTVRPYDPIDSGNFVVHEGTE